MALGKEYNRESLKKLKNSEKITLLINDFIENGPEKIIAWYTVQEYKKDDWEPGFLFETESGKLINVIFDDLTEDEREDLESKLLGARLKAIATKCH